MEDITIPGWAVMLVPTLILWLAWVTREMYSQNKSIALVAQKQDMMNELCMELRTKFDTFLHQEMQFLKSVSTPDKK